MTTFNTRDFRINKKFQVLKPVLEKWRDLNNERLPYKDDVAWWYNERASLSVFAGALWKCGGWAFEEFVIERKIHNRRKAQGRCDILFEFKNHKYIGEVKQTWLTIGKKGPRNIKEKVESDLFSAQHEIRQIHEKANHRIAMTFVVPEINISESVALSKHIEKFVQELHKIKNATLAWTFPSFARNMRPNNEYRDYIYPGVALVMISADQKNSASNKQQ